MAKNGVQACDGSEMTLSSVILVTTIYLFSRFLSAGNPSSTFRLEALVSVPADYPRGYPLFALRLVSSTEGSSSGNGSSKSSNGGKSNGAGGCGDLAQTHLNNDGIRDIERELNLYPDDLVNKAGKKDVPGKFILHSCNLLDTIDDSHLNFTSFL